MIDVIRPLPPHAGASPAGVPQASAVAVEPAALAAARTVVVDRLRASVPSGVLVVAFSGGVDSALLLALAVEALGTARVLAVTAVSESLPAAEREACARIARAVGAKHVEVETRELDRPGYVANASDRCYHCKTELFDAIDREVKSREDVRAVAYGATFDDLAEQHRPGMSAASERGVLRPLADARLGKAAIRALSQSLGLETWDKPAMACLASRIPYGQPVTAGKLSQVERAEAVVRALGFRELRVRHHQDSAGATARLELAAEDLARAVAPDTRDAIARGLRALGYRFVVLDLEGFRSGRLNESLPPVGPRALPLA